MFQVYGPAADVLTGIAAVGFCIALLSSAAAWLMGSDRMQAVASYDGSGPAWLGRFSERHGTPVTINLTSGAIGAALFVVASSLGEGDAATVFTAMVGVVLVFGLLSYLLIFPAVIALRYRHPDVPRPFRIPGGRTGVWLCGGLTTGWCVLASLTSLFPGLFDGAFLDDAALEDYGLDRSQYTALALGSVVAAIAVGLVFSRLGRPTRKAQG
ncbi:MAG: amino acid permease [Phycicoccus sp.]